MQKKNKLRKNDGNGAQVGPKVVEVKFALECAEAKDVYVCGDFNDWSPAAVRMIKRDESGHWESDSFCRGAAMNTNLLWTAGGLPIPTRTKTS